MTTTARRSAVATMLALTMITMGCEDPVTVDRLDLEPQAAIMPVEPGYIVYRAAGTAGHDIFRMDADGTDPVNLTETPGVHEGHPNLSADGGWVVYSRDGQIWKMTISGDDQQLLYGSGSGSSYDPAWSADGNQIAFSKANGSDADLWLMDSDGGNASAEVNDFVPGAIAVLRRDAAWGGNDYGYVEHIVSTKGSSTYIHGPDVPALLSGEAPAWSPDGTKLAFHLAAPPHAGRSQIYIIDDLYAVPAIATRVTFGPSDDTDPVWSPDGTRLVFTRTWATGPSEIWFMESGYQPALALAEGTQASWGPCYRDLVGRGECLRRD